MTEFVDIVADEDAGDDPCEAFTFVHDLVLPEVDNPMLIATALVRECEEFHELAAGEPVIMFVFRNFQKDKANRRVLGTLAVPRFMGENSAFASWLLALACDGAIPDFVMTLEHAWWREASLHQKLALVHHELSHAKHAEDKDGELKFDDDGKPVWGLVGHDLEEFNATVARYGAWKGDITLFLEAAKKGPDVTGLIPQTQGVEGGG